MTWAFLLVVLTVIVVPGPDVVVTLRNTIAGGRVAGAATAAGVCVASVIQGTLVSLGLGALIVQSQPIFMTLKWVGIAYLVFYLSLLPQFVGSDACVWSWLVHAWVLPVVGTAWLLVVVLLGGAAREKLLRPATRRIIDATSGLALLGFSGRLALQSD